MVERINESAPHSLLIISHDVVGRRMAGPGIRAYQLARVLARYIKTTLAVPNAVQEHLLSEDLAVCSYVHRDWDSLAPLVAQADICLAAGDLLHQFPQLVAQDRYLVIDGYDPLLPEWLALYAHQEPAEMAERWRLRLDELTQQYHWGDFYLCASERQRDWWLGLLEANGRVNPFTYAADPSLRRLVDLVPYGLDSTRPQRQQPIMKGVWPGLQESDYIVLWGGGLWPWLDPLTAIRAMSRVQAQRPDVKLVFPGARHPNPELASMTTHVEAAKRLAEELGLLDRAVFFGDWVSFTAWDDVLLESDLALTLHFDTIETRLAFRSRSLEYIRADLPVIATVGDATSELISQHGLGRCVAYEADDQVASAILELLATPKSHFAAAFAHARDLLSWERAAAPLIRYCQQPWRAADKPESMAAVVQRVQRSDHNQAHAELVAEQQRQAALIAAYEQGNFMRLMRKLAAIKRTFLGPRPHHAEPPG